MQQKSIKELYDEAKAAYHSLQIGTMAKVVVDGQDGTRVEYASADEAALYNYIQELAALLPTPLLPKVSGPAGFWF